MERVGDFGHNWSIVIAQFINLALGILFVGLIIYLIVKWTKQLNRIEEKLDRLEAKSNQQQRREE